MYNLYEFEFRHEDGRTWRIRMAHIRLDDWAEVEELTGMDAGELAARFQGLSMRAFKAIYYLARKQNDDPAPWDSDEINAQVGDLTLSDVTPESKKAPDPTKEAKAPQSKSKTS